MKSRRAQGLKAMILAGGAIMALAGAPAWAAEITGRVTLAHDGRAVSGAVVRIEALDRETLTSPEGYYTFTDVPAGAYSVSVAYLGAQSVARSITISAKQERVLDIAVQNDAPALPLSGQRAAFAAGLNAERAPIEEITVTAAGGLSDAADPNVAAILARLPGVSVIHDEGRPRFAVIRGLEGDFTAASIDGMRLTSTEEADRRAVLDIIDSYLIDRVSVAKSRTPDRDGDVIGGSVDIHTLSAFDRDRPHITLVGQGLYDEIREEWGSNVVLSASNILANGQLGIAGGLAVRDQTLGSDKVTTGDGVWLDSPAGAYPGVLALVNDDITRELTTAIFNIETRPTGAQRFFLNLFISETREQSFRNRLVGDVSQAGFAADLSGDDVRGLRGPYTAVRDLTDREEVREIQALRFGGRSDGGGGAFDYAACGGRAQPRAPDQLDTVFGTAGDGPLAIRLANPQVPVFVAELQDPAFYDASAFTLSEMRLINTAMEDDEFTFAFDVRREADWLGPDGFVKFGFKGRQREKSRAVDGEVFRDFGDADPVTLDAFVAAPEIDYQLNQIAPGPSAGPSRSFFDAERDGFTADAAASAVVSQSGDYRIEEDINAGYIMAQFDAGRLKLVGGLRLEDTEFDSRTVRVIDAPVGLALAAPAGFEEAAASGGRRVLIAPGVSNDTYTDALPSLHGVFDLRHNIRLRAGYQRAAARPNFADVAPAGRFVFAADGSLSGVTGAPDLERQVADKFDASVEWVIPNGLVRANLFTIDIDDYIAVQRFQDQAAIDIIGFGDAAAGVDVLTAVNLANTRISGLELSYEQALTFLPGALEGFLIALNYTYVDGEATLRSADGVSAGRSVAPPQLSNHLYNVIIGYDRGPVELRASAGYRDGYLDVIDFGGVGVDRFVDDFLTLDLSAQLEFTEGLRLFGVLSNIDDEPFIAYVPGANGGRLASQFDEYGFTGNLGLKLTY